MWKEGEYHVTDRMKAVKCLAALSLSEIFLVAK